MIHYVKKASGENEPFSAEKFKRSLKRVGAPSGLREALVKEVLARPDLDTTYKIYEYAYNRLKEETHSVAARYSLKSALYELGPEGFMFERFVGELFKAQDFSTEVGRIISGRCVDHEVDVVLEKNHEKSMVECKFHNRRGLKTDVKVALYVKARYVDLAEYSSPSAGKAFTSIWLVTNTQFTTQAIQYGLCAGVRLLGWAYPEIENIAYLIDTHGLHPVTNLTSLTLHQKRQLLSKGILLCKHLLEQPAAMHEFGFSQLTQQTILEECTILSAKNQVMQAPEND